MSVNHDFRMSFLFVWWVKIFSESC